jgi:phage FluMu gp28-like protein
MRLADLARADLEVEASLARFEKILPKSESLPLRLWVAEMKPYQRRWVFEPSRFAICNKSRQIGISFSSAATACLWGAFRGEVNTIISVGQDESDVVLEMVKKHARVLHRAGSEMARTVRKTSDAIVFASGGSVLALPSTGGRSYSGNVILDEFAYQKHAKEVWDAAAPVALLGHKMRVISTPNGVGNEYHDLWDFATNEDRAKSAISYVSEGIPWVAHEIPLSLAMSEGFKVDMRHAWGLAKGDPRLFAQFFECSFLDAQFQYVPTAALDSVLTYDPLGPLGIEDRAFEFFGGLDIGRTVDLTVLVVVRRHRATGRCRLVHVETKKRTDSTALHEMVGAAFARYRLKRLCVDWTGIGQFPGEDIKKKYSEKYDVPHRRPRVDLVNFTPKSKEEMATGLYTAIVKREIELPGSDAALPPATRPSDGLGLIAYNEAGTWKHLYREIASIQRKVTRSANVVYETPSTSEGHGDRAWATMLALHARDPVHPMLRALRGNG